MLKANDRQVGGTHYKTGGEEHWDRQYRLYGPGYFVGCITKYVERYPQKNGYQDLLKAQHFLEKLIELVGMEPKKDDDEERQRRYGAARDGQSAEGPVAHSHNEGLPSYLKPPKRRF